MPWHWKDGKPVAWVDADPASPSEAEPAPPAPRDNFVQNFLSGPLEIVPPPPRPRAPNGRPYRRAYPRRRG